MSKQAILDVLNERVRQDAKWGEQNHRNYGDTVDPDGQCMDWQARAEALKRLNAAAAAANDLAWDNILLEEVFEAFSEHDDMRLREELVQVAAVAVAWIECIDRRVKK